MFCNDNILGGTPFFSWLFQHLVNGGEKMFYFACLVVSIVLRINILQHPPYPTPLSSTLQSVLLASNSTKNDWEEMCICELCSNVPRALLKTLSLKGFLALGERKWKICTCLHIVVFALLCYFIFVSVFFVGSSKSGLQITPQHRSFVLSVCLSTFHFLSVSLETFFFYKINKTWNTRYL